MITIGAEQRLAGGKQNGPGHVEWPGPLSCWRNEQLNLIPGGLQTPACRRRAPRPT